MAEELGVVSAFLQYRNWGVREHYIWDFTNLLLDYGSESVYIFASSLAPHQLLLNVSTSQTVGKSILKWQF